MPTYFGNRYEYGQRGRTLEMIAEVLQNAGKPMSVNAIAREVDRPVSTIHKYLKGQSFIVQTEDKKWRYPDTYEDIYNEARVKELREFLDTIHNRETIDTVVNTLSTPGENRAELRTALLEQYVELEQFQYEIKRTIEFYKNTTTNALNQK